MPVSPAPTPFPPDFPEQLRTYCHQLAVAAGRGRHHDTRRHLFLNFLNQAFSVAPEEVELEHKVKVAGVRGRIDALYAHVIIEVKSDFDAEREDARRELAKYFASRPQPSQYIGLLTDGLRVEAWHLDRHRELRPISETVLRPDDPRRAWRWLDQFLSTGQRLTPTSDEHPVTVLMAKANLLLALRAELRDYPDEVNLRVYMADALMTGRDAVRGTIAIAVSKKEAFNIPLATVDRGDLDELIDFLSEFAKRGSRDDAAKANATRAVETRLKSLPGENEAFWWRQNSKLLLHLDEEKRNTIWAYILKNAYRPDFLRREKVDYIVGNPPWLSYRYIKDPAYKERVKALTFGYGLLGREEIKLFTQMDTATLFAVHCEREFLRPGGTLAMVLPKTVILPAKQHLVPRLKKYGASVVKTPRSSLQRG